MYESSRGLLWGVKAWPCDLLLLKVKFVCSRVCLLSLKVADLETIDFEKLCSTRPFSKFPKEDYLDVGMEAARNFRSQARG